ncbi:NAD(P)-dependent alcohol dehydrogenase [Chitinophaga barathri]|uniref:NAD(P)-dependent alcohol dehydrogenase n=1 Tax=Chitinophaga barathri TaxID=1647451 RepID=A0A3N4MI67_9BACT|nr:NAD(P)-dependent alcohol dehydrogenase [Chitinophaga barathri]RPD39760.1 NAD(P)-dependent alcohol dehydrogenase [Chitinophaga barathri]
MKAAIYTRYGPPEVVTIRNINKPSPRHNEILVKVHATTVNRTDCGFRSAQYFVSRLFSGLFAPRNKVLGCEFAGEVMETGASVSAFKAGDRVFGYDDAAFGSHAEYKIIPQTGAMAVIPAGMSYAGAAPLTEGSHYALFNIRAAGVKKGDKVMVYGATGAIGSAAVQLLKHFGAYVVAVAGTSHLSLVSSLGADEVIDYQTQDFTQTAHRFDFIFDAVGKRSFGECKPLLKQKGIYISTELGKRSENIFLALTTPITGKKRVLFPLPVIRKEDVLFLQRLAESGEFKPLIDREYPFDNIVDAYRFVETGQKTGNVVIRITEGSSPEPSAATAAAVELPAGL